MKNILFGLSSLLGLYTTSVLAQNSVQDIKNYLVIRDQLKVLDLAALQKITASPAEKNVKKRACYVLYLPENTLAGE